MRVFTSAACAALILGAARANAEYISHPPAVSIISARLSAGYPGIVTGIDGNDVVFADGSKLPFDDGRSGKSFSEWLETPDIEDMFGLGYPAGAALSAPPKDFDPGRARNGAFFEKIYGDCETGGVTNNLVEINWLPNKSGGHVKVTKINGVAGHLRAVSAELDALPSRFDAYLIPTAGTYNCRAIAGSKSRSAHGYGIAIDISLKHAGYWRWAKREPGGTIAYHNAIPPEIVAIFEKHGFIWGGRWHHYDTMHFEYRPELLSVAAPATPPQ